MSRDIIKAIEGGRIIDLVEDHKGQKFYPKVYRDITGRSVISSDIEILGTSQEITSGWVARDKDGVLNLHFLEPSRDLEEGDWGGPVGMSMLLPPGLFPDLTWNDKPLEVYINIIPKICHT